MCKNTVIMEPKEQTGYNTELLLLCFFDIKCCCWICQYLFHVHDVTMKK